MMQKSLTMFVIAVLPWLGCLSSLTAMASPIDVMKNGNQLFVQGKRQIEYPASGPGLIGDNTPPLAVVIAGSDIIIPPELLFHSKPGELIIFQNAGPVVDKSMIDSIQYYCKERSINTIVLLGRTGSTITKFAFEKKSSDKLSVIKTPILASLLELQRDDGIAFRKLAPDQQVDALTKRYIGNLVADFKEALSDKKVEVYGALVQPENGKMEWLGPVKRKTGARFGKRQ